MRIALWCLAVGALAGAARADDPLWSEEDFKRGKQVSQAECGALPNAVWVEHRFGTECIRYFPSKNVQGAAHVVVTLHGDIIASRQPFRRDTYAALMARTEKRASRHGVPVITLARPGCFGSSGRHPPYRRSYKETWTIHAALDAIRARHGIGRIALAGQSSGASIGLSMLTLGRKDMVCLGLGAGGWGTQDVNERLYDAADSRKRTDAAKPRTGFLVKTHLAGILPDPARHIYLLSDPQDKPERSIGVRYVYSALKQAGHAVTLIEKPADGGRGHHNLYGSAMKAAVACVKGSAPDAVVALLRREGGDDDPDEPVGDADDDKDETKEPD